MLSSKKMEGVVILKRSLILPVLLIVVCVMATAPALAQLKFGYIDTNRIIANYQKSIDAQKTLEAERDAALQELQKMEEDFVAAQQALQQQTMLLSQEKKQEKEQELQQMYAQIQRAGQEKDQQLARRQTEVLKPVYDDINAAIRKLSDAEGYDFIVDAVNLLDAKEEYDLTEKVMVELGIDVSKLEEQK